MADIEKYEMPVTNRIPTAAPVASHHSGESAMRTSLY